MCQNIPDGMPPLVFMITIVDRKYAEKLTALFTEEGVPVNLITLGSGTANSKILNRLGLGETEKAILFSIMPSEISKNLLKKLDKEDALKKPGHGISFAVPVSSIVHVGIPKQLKYLPQAEGEINMEQNFDHDLIIAVTNRGFSDEVMEAAYSANAKGGTVVHARGTGLKEAEKFFGITIQPEKELVLILSSRETRQEIMNAISSKAGVQTDAKAIVFSLPVNGVAGLANSLSE